LIFPVDQVAWLKNVKDRVLRTSRKVTQNIPNLTSKELWLGGTATPVARQNLEAQGWVVKENVFKKLPLD